MDGWVTLIRPFLSYKGNTIFHRIFIINFISRALFIQEEMVFGDVIRVKGLNRFSDLGACFLHAEKHIFAARQSSQYKVTVSFHDRKREFYTALVQNQLLVLQRWNAN